MILFYPNFFNLFFFLFSVVFSLFFIMNLVLWSKSSSAAVPFTTLVALLGLWFGVSVPLTFIGAYFGFRKRVIRSILICIDMHSINMISGLGTSSSNESNPTIDTGAIYLHPTGARHYNGGCFTIRLHFHTIILHFKFALGIWNVLHVRFPIPSVYNSGHYLRGNHSIAMLFPSMRWRLSLVVAVLSNIRLHSCLLILLLLPLFLFQITNRRRSLRLLVFRLYIDYGVSVQFIDRNYRILRLL